LTDDESKGNGEYLLVELVDEGQGVGDVRNLGKRKYVDQKAVETPNKRGRSQKVLEDDETNGAAKANGREYGFTEFRA
ncbi:16067_t:CDS:2, partial [Dentiscutata heterogama]